MEKFKVNIRLLEDQGLNLCYGEPVIFHCNHYNLFLQRTIEDVEQYIDVKSILVEGAVFATYSMFRRLFEVNSEIKEPMKRLSIASHLYSHLGFGLLPAEGITEDGGVIKTPITHYSYGWQQKWGIRKKPVDYFTCGYLQSAMANAFYKHPSHYVVEQTKCISMGDKINEFHIKVNQGIKSIPISPGMGVTIKQRKNLNGISNNINETEITKAVRGMPLVGNEQGLINAFGVFLTRHFANYYNYISYETARLITEKTNEADLARDLLVEAGHVCGFNTFEGLWSQMNGMA